MTVIERWGAIRDYLLIQRRSRTGRRFFISVGAPFCKRWVEQYPAGLSGGFQSPAEIKASATQCSTGALLRMLRHGGSQPRKEEGASHHARRGKNAEAFLNADYKKQF